MSNKEIIYINTNKPRDSIVVKDMRTAGVIKMPTTKRPEYITSWLGKQRHACMAVDFLLGYKNRLGGYFVPKITEIGNYIKTPYVREQRALGRALTKEYFDSLPVDIREHIYQVLANFVCDMNHCRPILNLQQKLTQQNEYGLNFDDILDGVSRYLNQQEIVSVKSAYKFFLSHPEMTSSLVFFHGDMNENNMFYDSNTDTISFLDFSEATYETVEYIFDHDLIKLPWLDSKKLVEYYKKIPKNDVIQIRSNPAMLKLYDALSNFKRTSESIISNSDNNKVFEIILHDNVKQITSTYSTIFALLKQNVQSL